MRLAWILREDDIEALVYPEEPREVLTGDRWEVRSDGSGEMLP